MDNEKINTFILTNKAYFLDEDLRLIKLRLESINETKWHEISTITFKDPQIALMLSIFGGPIGVDRFYIGDYAKGVLKTVTIGGLLIWAFVDQFLIRKSTKEHNRQMLFNIIDNRISI
ncbi:MAG: TM2 domain-containing protein [Bacteroidales bacterium]|nr:TM2 domain-containing protein [Bacteroidales bacterium]